MMFDGFFLGEAHDFSSFKRSWNFTCVGKDDRQNAVDTLMRECVPGHGERVLYALVLLFQQDPSSPVRVSLEKARYLRLFYDSTTNEDAKQAFLYLVKKGALVVTHSRPFEHLSRPPVCASSGSSAAFPQVEASSTGIHERLLFLKTVLQSGAPSVTSQEVAALRALLTRYQESKLLSTCPLRGAGSDGDLSSLVDELKSVVDSYEAYTETFSGPTQPPLNPRFTLRSRFSASNPVLPLKAGSDRATPRPMSAPPQRKRPLSGLRSTTPPPPLESFSNMPSIHF